MTVRVACEDVISIYIVNIFMLHCAHGVNISCNVMYIQQEWLCHNIATPIRSMCINGIYTEINMYKLKVTVTEVFKCR